MADEYVMKENTGSLFHETKVTVPRKGKMKIGNTEQYGAILKYVDKNGNEKYELVASLGLLHYNPPESKRTEGTPDIGGKITYNNTVYKCGGYANQTQTGIEYTKLLFTPYDEEGNLIIPEKNTDNSDAAF